MRELRSSVQEIREKQMKKQILAADYGASGGRVMLGEYDGSRIRTSQVHRFVNEPVWLGGTMFWDFLRLFHELKTGIKKAQAYGKADSIGVDTWGVDFGLIDKQGFLLENPVHYRDGRTAGMLEAAWQKVDRDRIYEITGNQFMEINTAFQLLSLAQNRPELLDRAEKLLLMPDLFNYGLCGTACSEYTMASTTQLLDAVAKDWSRELIRGLGLPEKIFLPVIQPGTVLGPLDGRICSELEVKPLDVVAVAGHDTQCALAAVPAREKDFIFVSCGTWSLFGTQLESPVIDARSAAYNITNEGACGGETSFLKNIIGLWLVQESRRQWMREGQEYSFGQLDEMAAAETGGESFVDPDAPVFVPAGNVPERIRTWCRQRGQKVPETPGQIVRCIHESLALKYRSTLEEIRACTGKEYKAIHLVGGGCQSRLLCQLVADVCGLPVYAGPVEATVYGNLGLQLTAAGELSDPGQIRELVLASEEIRVYEPKEQKRWEEIRQRFAK